MALRSFSRRLACLGVTTRIQELFRSPTQKRDRRSVRFAGASDIGTVTQVLENRALLATFVVDDDGAGDFTSIQAAIDSVAAGDTLQISGGADRVHTEQGIVVSKDLTLEGTAGTTKVIVQAHAQPGMATERVFEVQLGQHVTFDNLTIRHGNTLGELGGGGIFNQGTATVLRSSIIQNAADDGGGIFSAGSGGELTVIDSTVAGNTARDTGGGVVTALRVANISNSTISGNKAVFGGGISNIADPFPNVSIINLTNSTVSGNSADRGGGLSTDGNGVFYVANSTIAQNTATQGGGLFSLSTDTGESGQKTLNNTIIAGNIGGDIGNSSGTVVISGTNNLIQDGIVPGGLVDSVIGDPRLGPLTDNGGPTFTHALLVGSAAFDQGSDAAAVDEQSNTLTTDQRGLDRFVGTVDIGAYESSPFFITVNTLMDENNGIESGGVSLREAIAAVAATGTITFDSSLADGTISLGGGQGELVIDKPLVIDGESHNITINGQGTSRVFRVSDSNTENERFAVAITGLTITGGTSVESGGGIENNEVLTLTRVIVSGNSSGDSGGGIINEDGSLQLIDSLVSNNESTAAGGGIGSINGPVSLLRTSITGNLAGTVGGAVTSVVNAELRIRDSTISGNSSITDGGAIFNFGRVIVTNSTLSGNTTQGRGGAIFNIGILDVVNSTVFGNTAGNRGGGIDTIDFEDVLGITALDNTIVAGNTGGDLTGNQRYSGRNNLVQDGIVPGTLTNTIIADPRLGPLQNNGGFTETHALLSDSLAINAGENFVAVDRANRPLQNDQRGRERFVSTVDIGAYELAPQTITVTTSVDENDGINSGGVSLRDAITAIGEGGAIFFEPVLAGTTIELVHGELRIERSLTIDGGTRNISVNALGNSRVIHIDDGDNSQQSTVMIAGLTITRGGNLPATETGGGILNRESLTLANSLITKNLGSDGGGGIANTGTLTINDSTISDNSAGGEGGGIQSQGGVLTIARSTITQNTGTAAGGIRSSGTVTITDTTISKNTATSFAATGNHGGGVVVLGSPGGGLLTIKNSTISTNSAKNDGGGLYTNYTTRLINSTISENIAGQGNGGGILSLHELFATNSTIVNNSAATGQGGVVSSGIISTTVLNNTIVGGNVGGDLGGTGTYSGTNNLIQDGSGTGLTNTLVADPLLGDLQDNGGLTETHSLLSNSPAINAGENAVAVDELGSQLAFDQRGQDRFADNVDIGAVEIVTLAITSSTPNLAEGNDSATNFQFTVTLTGNITGTTTVDFAVTGTDIETSDFVGGTLPTGTLTFNEGESQKTITIAIEGDQIVEEDESFTVTLSNPSNGTAVAVAQASGLVVDDDSSTLTLTGVNASQTEGTDGSQTDYVFFVTLENAVEGGLEIAYTTNDETATIADNDYLDNDGSLSFVGNAGELKAITVQVNHDAKVEADEVFNVVLGAISGLLPGINPARVVTLGSPHAGTIQNDDVATLVLAGVDSSKLEDTGTGNTSFIFSVTLDNPVAGGFNISYSTNDGPIMPDPNIAEATLADNDYVDNDDTLQFSGIASERQFITVEVIADTQVEATELFHVALGSISGLASGIDPNDVKLSSNDSDRRQTGTILNNENRMGITVGDTTSLTFVPANSSSLIQKFATRFPAIASMSGSSFLGFLITSSAAVAGPFEVNVSTTDGTATVADGDYVPKSEAITFDGNPGEEQLFLVEINPNLKVEPSLETFFVSIGTINTLGVGVDPANIIPLTTVVSGEISNDTAANITLDVDDAIQNEGTGGGVTEFTFTVTLDIGVEGGFSIGYTTNDLSARDDNDYIDNDGVLQFAGTPGESKTIAVQVHQDEDEELDEAFAVALGSISGLQTGIDPSSLTLGGPQTATIQNDDEQFPIVVTAPGPGGGPHIRVFNAESGDFSIDQTKTAFFAYSENFTGGVRIATADVTGDGVAEIITGPGPGGGPHIRVFDSNTGQLVYDFFAFDPRFGGGVYVSAADFNHDGKADIIVAADAGGGPHIKVFDGTDQLAVFPEPTIEFFAYAEAFTGGVRVATADVNGDGTPDIITGPGPGGGPHVRAFDGSELLQDRETELTNNFFPFSPAFLGGVFVAGGDFNNDGHAEVVVGAGPGGGPHVHIRDIRNDVAYTNEFPYADEFRGGVTVAVTNVGGSNTPEVITGPASQGPPRIVILNVEDPENNTVVGDFRSYAEEFSGGVFVAGEFSRADSIPNVASTLVLDEMAQPKRTLIGEATSVALLGEQTLSNEFVTPNENTTSFTLPDPPTADNARQDKELSNEIELVTVPPSTESRIPWYLDDRENDDLTTLDSLFTEDLLTELV